MDGLQNEAKQIGEGAQQQTSQRDANIAGLEGEIAGAAKTAEGAEMDELRRKGDKDRVGFELQLAGARNVNAARALLLDHDDDIEKLKAAEPWLFSAPAAQALTGATGLRARAPPELTSHPR